MTDPGEATALARRRRAPVARAVAALAAAACASGCGRDDARPPVPQGSVAPFPPAGAPPPSAQPERAGALPRGCAPRRHWETSGFGHVMAMIRPWDGSSLRATAESFQAIGHRLEGRLLIESGRAEELSHEWMEDQLGRASLLHYEGDVAGAAKLLAELRERIAAHRETAMRWSATVAWFQGVTAMRRAENENCVECRGASACILPLDPAAVHRNPAGSREAIRHFTDILDAFPDDLGAKWLLNVAHMTLGEWPDGVDARFRLPLEGFLSRPGAMPRFADVAHEAGIGRLNMAGGAILEDLDGDGWLDAVLSSFDPAQSMAVYRNRRDGTFEDRSEAAGVGEQTGGLFCCQTDYDGDGHADLFVVRGAWYPHPVRPSLLRNRGDGTFEDVTAAAGLAAPVNAISAAWADFDGDGRLDVFVPCERQPSRLWRNLGNGRFEDVAASAGVACPGAHAKGAAWIDYDDDGREDLYVSVFGGGSSALFRNEGGGRFRDVSKEAGIDGPRIGFSCWSFDYDNDGRLDLFATSYDRGLPDVVKGLTGGAHERDPSRLWRNLGGGRFEETAAAAGLGGVYETMGSNFADFDGDGFLDVYLGTGDPNLATIVPNRMFRNEGGAGGASGGGRRFADVTAASGTGHLQKGHGVACGDYDRDGDVDLLVELGGAVPGDRFHDVLFRNPGNGSRSVTVKLRGVRTNRAGVGARIKVVTGGAAPLTVHRVVSSGGSFGANPFEQTIGVGSAETVALLEVRWPASGSTQTFRDVPVGRRIEIAEFAEAWTPADPAASEEPR